MVDAPSSTWGPLTRSLKYPENSDRISFVYRAADPSLRQLRSRSMRRDEMERRNDAAEILVELGTASIVTQGPGGERIEMMGLWHKDGISDQ